MTKHQWIRKLTALVATMEATRVRVEALVGAAEADEKKTSTSKTKTSKKESKKSKSKGGTRRREIVGQTIKFGKEGKVKVVERKAGKFLVKALTKLQSRGKTIPKGRVFAVSNVYVYRVAA